MMNGDRPTPLHIAARLCQVFHLRYGHKGIDGYISLSSMMSREASPSIPSTFNDRFVFRYRESFECQAFCSFVRPYVLKEAEQSSGIVSCAPYDIHICIVLATKQMVFLLFSNNLVGSNNRSNTNNNSYFMQGSRMTTT